MVAAGATAATQVPSGVSAAELLASLLSPPVQPVGDTREEKRGRRGAEIRTGGRGGSPALREGGGRGRLRGALAYVVETVFPDLINAFSRDHSQGEFDRLVVAELGPGTLKHLEVVITKSLAHVHESLLQPGLS